VLCAAVLPCRHRALDGQEEEAALLEELLLAALHMYKVGCRDCCNWRSLVGQQQH
jgi:hypothetical protein